ncbi:unnamed protein product [Cylindrotheca closterium]|uniref:Terpene cyclase/mutase family member n=1 Tax=Cylindrotheca closterium TaxID=2856 RepID=A0AAD2JKJ3_9STRA|nr:unnamed protein product [Cylindrotheca closterium]
MTEDRIQIALGLIGWSSVMVLSALAMATGLAATPLDQLGMRPNGSCLWSWLYHHFVDSVGVGGYDAIQGALAPPLRLNFHMAGVLLLWASFVYFSDQQYGECVFSLPLSIWWSGLHSMCLYTLYFFVLNHLMDGVSVPGGPRASKIQRQPIWDDRLTTLDDEDKEKWKCMVAEESHEDTETKFPGKKLTGEPSGRQIWSRATTSASNHDKEKLIQEMALGGRSYSGFNPSKNPNSSDVIFRAHQIRKYLSIDGNVPPPATPPKSIQDCTRKAAHFYSMLQCSDGHFAADYGGPHFLMPGLVIAWYIMGKPSSCLNNDQIKLLKHYILVHQQSDGGWGTHIESPPTMFGSTLMYVAMRLLGVPKDDPAAVRGRKFLKENGGVLYTSSWSKFYLCLLGLMDWRGHNSVPPEMWLLPNWFPFHPGRMWCHARMVYLPMGYLYGSQFVYEDAETDATIQSLRSELYCENYINISWVKTRHWVSPLDDYSPIPLMMKTMQNLLACYENWDIFQPFKRFFREKGIKFSLKYIHAEDKQTNYIDIGPVNKVLNMISHYHATGNDLNDPTVVDHMMRVQDYLWIAEDGMKMQGYNGSQCWDTSFCAQALFEANLLDEFPGVSRKIWNYLERTQILSTEVSQSSPAYKYEANEYRNMYYRHISEGGWPFSTSAHGWPISDCTSEGLKAVLCLLRTKCIQDSLKDKRIVCISEQRLYKAINVLLTYQNEDGGWATYENNRGWGWYEQLNPSEVFGDIMIDYSYVECSMATLTALVDFREMYPHHRPNDIQQSINKGHSFLKSVQREDGSWYGSWACCFTYGTFFGIEGLVKCGESLDSTAIVRACKFLLQHQRKNGGWGEDFTSCYDKDYAKNGMKRYGDEGSGVVNTAWALLGLSIAKYDDVDAIRRGVQYLMKRQLPSGDWPQEGISGVFNRSVGITYTAYRNVFPIWALGRCYAVYGNVFNETE